MTSGRIRPWVAVAIAVGCIGWGGNQFTPLLIAYAQDAGYTPVDVDILLGAYVVGLVPGLLLASALSDRHGRRRVMVGGVISSALGSLILAVGDFHGFPSLFAERLLSGLAVGIAMAVGSAWIAELSRPPFGESSPGAGARRASICLSVGFALGPLCAGLLAALAPLPLVLTYLLHAALCPPALWVVQRHTVETRTGPPTRSILQGLKVPAAGHRRFVRVVIPMAPWVFGSAAATAITRSAIMALLVVMLLGCAYGIAIVSGLLEIQRIANPDELAGISGVYYALAYLGFLLPAALAGLAHFFSYPAMLTGVGLLAIGAAAMCAAGWSKHLEPQTHGSALVSQVGDL